MSKKPFFTIKVFIHVLVIIQVITGQVGKYTCIKPAKIHSVQIKPMGGDFHDDMGDPCFFHFMQGFLKINGIRCGDGIVKNQIIIPDIDGSDDTGCKSASLENTFQQPRGCGLAVGPGDTDKGHSF